MYGAGPQGTYSSSVNSSRCGCYHLESAATHKLRLGIDPHLNLDSELPAGCTLSRDMDLGKRRNTNRIFVELGEHFLQWLTSFRFKERFDVFKWSRVALHEK